MMIVKKVRKRCIRYGMEFVDNVKNTNHRNCVDDSNNSENDDSADHVKDHNGRA